MNETSTLTPFKFLQNFACKSKNMLFVVIAYTVSLTSGLLGFFSLKTGLLSTAAEITALLGELLGDEAADTLATISEAAQAIASAVTVIALAGLLPVLLKALGALLLYLGAKKGDASLACKGTLLLRILFTLHTVLCSLGIALTVICVIAVFVNAPKFVVLAVIIGVIAIIPLGIANTYYGKFTKMFSQLGTSLCTGINVLRVSELVTVINWIFAVCGIISAVTSLGSNLFGSASSFLSAGALIIVTTAFSEYKKMFGDPAKNI